MPDDLGALQERVTRRYWESYAEARDEIVASFDRYIDELIKLYERKDADDMWAWVKANIEEAMQGIGSATSAPATLPVLAMLADATRRTPGAVLGEALFGPRTIAYGQASVVPIAGWSTPADLDALTTEDLAALPPISLLIQESDPEDPTTSEAFIVSADHVQVHIYPNNKYQGTEIAAASTAFADVVSELCDYINGREMGSQSLPPFFSEDQADERAHAQELTQRVKAAAWAWWRDRTIAKRMALADLRPLPPAYKTFTTIAQRGMMAAISSGRTRKGWAEGPRGPRYLYEQNQGSVEIEMRSASSSSVTLSKMWDLVSQLDDTDSDILELILSTWILRRDDSGVATISPEMILNQRGVAPKRKKEGGKFYSAGHRPDDLADIEHRIDKLENLHIRLRQVEVFRGTGKKRKPVRVSVDARYYAIMERLTQETLDRKYARTLGYRYRMGDWAKEITEQFAIATTKLVEYDPYRQSYEKRLGRYFTYALPIAGGSPLRRKIKSVLEETSLLPIDAAHPERSKERITKALNQIAADGIIARWEYGEKLRLPPRGWVQAWLDATVVVYPVRRERLENGSANPLTLGP